jgi:hypothetical protein
MIPSDDERSISCPVCSSAAAEPFMADCGHVACLGCWKAWLSRSESCPTCRQATSIESLARIVVSSCPPGGKSSALALSRLCPPTAEARLQLRPGAKGVDDEATESELEVFASDM